MSSEHSVSVLLVDDQPSNLMALEAILRASSDQALVKLNLVRAYSGEQALLRVLDDEFAAILMDVQMPGMDGFEAAELIRQRERSEHVPILFLTAYPSDQLQIERGYALGAVDFLSKPVVPAVLRAKIAVFVELFLKGEQIKRQAERLVETQRRDHVRELAEEKQRWEVDRLRAEAAREKQIATELAEKADALTRSIAEREQADEQLRRRIAQQAVVADLGQRALAGAEPASLLDEAVATVAPRPGRRLLPGPRTRRREPPPDPTIGRGAAKAGRTRRSGRAAARCFRAIGPCAGDPGTRRHLRVEQPPSRTR